MSDSPALQEPLDPKEQQILDKLVALRDQLLLLKQDKSTYIKSQDILPLYELVVEQVHQLNDARSDKRGEQNRGSRLSLIDGISWTAKLRLSTVQLAY